MDDFVGSVVSNERIHLLCIAFQFKITGFAKIIVCFHEIAWSLI